MSTENVFHDTHDLNEEICGRGVLGAGKGWRAIVGKIMINYKGVIESAFEMISSAERRPFSQFSLGKSRSGRVDSLPPLLSSSGDLTKRSVSERPPPGQMTSKSSYFPPFDRPLMFPYLTAMWVGSPVVYS